MASSTSSNTRAPSREQGDDKEVPGFEGGDLEKQRSETSDGHAPSDDGGATEPRPK